VGTVSHPAILVSTDVRGGFHWGGQDRRAEGRERGWGSSSGGRNPAPHQLRGLRERCELPNGVRGGAPTAQRFSTIFSTRDGLSWHYNIVNIMQPLVGQDPPCPACVRPCAQTVRSVDRRLDGWLEWITLHL